MSGYSGDGIDQVYFLIAGILCDVRLVGAFFWHLVSNNVEYLAHVITMIVVVSHPLVVAIFPLVGVAGSARKMLSKWGTNSWSLGIHLEEF